MEEEINERMRKTAVHVTLKKKVWRPEKKAGTVIVEEESPENIPQVSEPVAVDEPTIKIGNRKEPTKKEPYVFRSSERYERNLVLKSVPEAPDERPFPLSMIPSSRYSVGENIRRFIFIISAIVMVCAAVFIGVYFWSNYQSEKQNDELRNLYSEAAEDVHDDTAFNNTKNKNGTGSRLIVEQPKKNNSAELLPGAKKLLDINSDVAGYIQIPDTEINYPVMRSKKDNNEYLKKNIYGEWMYAGSIFMDFRDKFDEIKNGQVDTYSNSDNIVIYGHNMRDESMFGTLKKYINEDNYYENHPCIYLNSNYKKYTYKIFGFFIADPSDKNDFDYWNKLDFDSKDDYYDYIDEIKRRSIRNTKVDMEYGDDLLILSTCNSLIKGGRFVVAARRCRPGEDVLEGTTGSTKNENVKMPSSYYSGKSTYDESKFEGYERK